MLEYTFVFKKDGKSNLVKRSVESIDALYNKVAQAAEHCDQVSGLTCIVWGPGMAARQASHYLADMIAAKPWPALLAAFEQPIEEVGLPADF